MFKKSSIRSVTALVAAIFLFAAGCEERPPDLTISQFDRPQDVALVCYDLDAQETRPLDCCRTSGEPVIGECGVGLPNDLAGITVQRTNHTGAVAQEDHPAGGRRCRGEATLG